MNNQRMNEADVEDEDRIAAVVIFIAAFVGLIVNAFIVIYIRRLAVLRNSFGRLLQLQAIGDGIFVGVWAIYFAPVLLFDFKAVQRIEVAARFGQLCLICYDISIYSHLVISLNRFTSVFMPTHYKGIFTERFTTGLIAGIVLISFGFSFFLVLVSCQMGFSIQQWMLDYVTPPCNLIHVYYAEFLRGLIVITIFAIVNCCTFVRMILYHRKKANNAFEATQQSKRRCVEKTFVQQVTLQGALYVAELVTYFYVATFFPVDLEHVTGGRNRWPNFLLTTYAWILVHTLDGVITLTFNKQFRRVFVQLFKRTKSTTVASRSASHFQSAMD
ncbi:hypothetical protein V3C99_001644 [Haemonchus contortus]|uniref:G_PROTEIN_RECEP_F1_2 domain-containing protein n=1 Tax=Haemonchus contortus TaxID=6289 RepID=A0A7I4YDS5_HAECO